jgi:hypothetical protein
MGDVFWRLSDGNTVRGLAESDLKVMKQLEAQYGGMQQWIPMHRVSGVPIHVLLRGGRVNDIIWTWDNQCLIQDRVLQMFVEQGFSGYQVHPVSAAWKKKTLPEMPEIPTLWEFIPTGWAGVAPKESGIHRLPSPPGYPDRLRYSRFTDPSKLMDVKQWDGSDFFILWPMPVYINVTDRVAQFIQENKLRTAVLQRLDGLPVSTNDSPITSGYTPGPLSWYLPEERAREIGEPLGIY